VLLAISSPRRKSAPMSLMPAAATMICMHSKIALRFDLDQKKILGEVTHSLSILRERTTKSLSTPSASHPERNPQQNRGKIRTTPTN